MYFKFFKLKATSKKLGQKIGHPGKKEFLEVPRNSIIP